MGGAGRAWTWEDLHEKQASGAYVWEVAHKDGNPLNCTLANLRVMRRKDNAAPTRAAPPGAGGARPIRGKTAHCGSGASREGSRP